MNDIVTDETSDIFGETLADEPWGASDAVGAAGLALTTAFLLASFFSDALLAGSPVDAICRPVGMVSFCASYYLIRRFSDALSSRKLRLGFLCLAAATGSLAPAIGFAGYWLGSVPAALIIVSWAGIGLAGTLLTSFWAEYSAMLTVKRAMPTTAVSFVLGAGIYLGIANIDQPLSPFMQEATLLVSIACCYLFSRDRTLPEIVPLEESRLRLELFRRTETVLVLYGVVFGLVLQESLTDRTLTDPNLFVPFGIFAGTALLAIALALRKGKPVSAQLAQRVLYPALICELVASLVDCDPLVLALRFSILALFGFYLAVEWGTLASLASLFRAQPIYHFSRRRGPLLLGVSIGWLVGFASLEPGLAAALPAASHLIAFALIVLLSLAVAITPFGFDQLTRPGALDEKDRADNDRRRIGAWRQTCLDIALHASLTPREREVFFLLAKGRNSEYIGKELFISIHTARTHTYRIYRKLDIASQQELINLVEEGVKQQMD